MRVSNEIQTTSAASQFRSIAADRFKAVADMSLHELCDEFVRLTAIVEAGKTEDAGEYGATTYTDEANVALRERNIVNGAARARFGIGFETYDYDF